MANIRFCKALKRETQAIPPIWCMRQAGRYHKHYQSLRTKYSFMELCKNPKLAAQVALGPIEDFDFDVAILFSDILFPLEAIGMGLEYTNSGPKLNFSLTTQTFTKIKKLQDSLDFLNFQGEALQLTRELLPKDKSLIGFIGGPWTLFTYAVEGKHSGNLIEVKKKLQLFQPFCDVLIPLLERNIQNQLESGAEVVMIFDTAAGEVSPAIYEQFITRTIQILSERFPNQVAYYAKGIHKDHLQTIAEYKFAGLGFDHRWKLDEILKNSKHGFIQGNFDQSLLFCSQKEFKTHLMNYLQPLLDLKLEERAGWVCGLGHGVLPMTPEENVKSFVQIVREVFSNGK